MKRQKKNESGITLVALVVSIIVMLVLAGVSLNATIGENGIVTRAQEAALQQKVAEELENLNLELTKLNVDTISTDETMAIQDIANYLVGKGVIDDFVRTSSGQIAAGIDTTTGNKYFFGTKGDNTYRITRGTDGLLNTELTTYTSGGDITGGYALITADSFTNDTSLSAEEKGKFTITSDAEVVFMDTITGALSIKVEAGVHATVGIYADMTLTNQGISRSAIDISETGILDLYIGDGVEVTVNSGIGRAGSIASGLGAQGGPGGFAGIHVTWTDSNNNNILDLKENTEDYDSYSVLNIYGNGKIIAIGGNAGDGAGAYSGDTGGGGGGGAGAGIGGNGGAGGGGNSNMSWSGYSNSYTVSGYDGVRGENCGLVNIHGTTEVYAYGGGGGSAKTNTNNNSGTGGGGYPAAGIGGGGAGGGGGDHAEGGGGYSGGSGQTLNKNTYNGDGGENNQWGAGAGYFGDGISPGQPFDSKLPGQGGTSLSSNNSHNIDSGGDGGIAGYGGIIKVSKDANVYAYNGNKYTDGLTGHEYNDGENQLDIYLQLGTQKAIYITNYQWGIKPNKNYSFFYGLFGSRINITQNQVSNPTKNEERVNVLVRTERTDSSYLSGYQNKLNNSTLGVGSGAGFIEISNGTYTRYNEDSLGNFTTEYTGT